MQKENLKSKTKIKFSPNLFRGVDPKFIKKVMPLLKALWDHYFRCEIEGWEKLPPDPALFVGNHNGVLTFQVLMMFYALQEKFQGSRHALGLAHGIVLDNPVFEWLLPRLGAIPANPEIADEALRRKF